MPVMRVGLSANAATTASVWATSESCERSASMPWRRPVPVTVVRSVERSTVAPMRSSRSTKPRSPCSESVPRPSTVTEPPTMAAAANAYEAALASGSMW